MDAPKDAWWIWCFEKYPKLRHFKILVNRFRLGMFSKSNIDKALQKAVVRNPRFEVGFSLSEIGAIFESYSLAACTDLIVHSNFYKITLPTHLYIPNLRSISFKYYAPKSIKYITESMLKYCISGKLKFVKVSMIINSLYLSEAVKKLSKLAELNGIDKELVLLLSKGLTSSSVETGKVQYDPEKAGGPEISRVSATSMCFEGLSNSLVELLEGTDLPRLLKFYHIEPMGNISHPLNYLQKLAHHTNMLTFLHLTLRFEETMLYRASLEGLPCFRILGFFSCKVIFNTTNTEPYREGIALLEEVVLLYATDFPSISRAETLLKKSTTCLSKVISKFVLEDPLEAFDYCEEEHEEFLDIAFYEALIHLLGTKFGTLKKVSFSTWLSSVHRIYTFRSCTAIIPLLFNLFKIIYGGFQSLGLILEQVYVHPHIGLYKPRNFLQVKPEHRRESD